MRIYTRATHLIDGDWNRPSAITIPSIQFPFQGDTKNRLYSQQFVIKKDYYPRFIPNNGDTWAEDSNYFWLKDDGFTELGSGYVQYTRHWGMLPGFVDGFPRYEYGSMVWTKPGFTTEDVGFQIYFIDTSRLQITNGAAYLYTTVTHNLTDTKYKYAQVSYNVTDPGSLTHQRTTIQPILSRGDDWIAIPLITDGLGGPILYNWFSKPQLNREPKQVVVPYIDYVDYFMPGVNCKTPQDIPVIQQWNIINDTGNETEYLSENSHPPLWDNIVTGEDGYYTMVANREMIVAEPSIINRWQVGGDIYERRTKYIQIV